MEGGDVRLGMSANRDNPDGLGITQRSVSHLFDRIEQMKRSDPKRMYSIFVSFLQIYNEKVFDLLNPQALGGGPSGRKAQPPGSLDGQQGLRIRWTKKD